jgi:endoglucanase
MIGVGSRDPRCPQHVVANLVPRERLVGAVVNGPNDRSLFADGLGEFFDEGRDCHTAGYGAFSGRGSRYVDDVRSWQTVEPAIDFTAAAALAFALEAAG